MVKGCSWKCCYPLVSLEVPRCLLVVELRCLSVGVEVLWSEEHWLGPGFAGGNMAHKASDRYEFCPKRDS